MTDELKRERDIKAELLEALQYASDILKVARRYFPKSIKNSDTFQLENTNAAINKAMFKALADDSGSLTLPYALIGLAAYMVYWMIAHGVFQALTALQAGR